MPLRFRIDRGAQNVASECCPAVYVRSVLACAATAFTAALTLCVVVCRETTSAAILAYNGTRHLLMIITFHQCDANIRVVLFGSQDTVRLPYSDVDES
jgi:hypothetical protein